MKNLALTLVILFYSSFLQAHLSLQLDNSKIQMGQTCRITLTKDNAALTGAPDLSPLRKDFEIIGTQQLNNYSVINGQVHSTSQWIISLMPKKIGVLTIPSLQIGQEHTPPERLEVTIDTDNSSSTKLTNAQQALLLTAEVDEPNPFVNQQVLYTVKLYNSRQLIDAEYRAPEIKDGLLIALGKNRQYQTTKNGQVYEVEEQRYVIFPQKSNVIKINPPSFKATVFDALPRVINIQAKATTLHVKPAPEAYRNKGWLPAKAVSLSENYDRATDGIMQGTTLVRTLTLRVEGVPAQLLPAFEFAKTSQFDTYYDKPIENNSYYNKGILGTITVNITYLFNKPGRVVIPAVEIPWFNTVTEKEEKAFLPSVTLNVKASSIVQPNDQAVSAKQDKPPATAIKPQKKRQLLQQRENSNEGEGKGNTMPWSLVLGLIFIGLATLIMRWIRRNFHQPTNRLLLKRLRNACMTNQPQAARIALLTWANQQWPDREIVSLEDISKSIDDSNLQSQLNLLLQALYYPGQQPWLGRELWLSVKYYKKAKKRYNKKRDGLPPLNPS